MKITDQTLDKLIEWDQHRREDAAFDYYELNGEYADTSDELESAIENLKATEWLETNENITTDEYKTIASHPTHEMKDQPPFKQCEVTFDELLPRLFELVDRSLVEPFTAEYHESPGLFLGRLVREGILTPFQARRFCERRCERLVHGDYEIIDRLGAGGMGQVFRARHRKMGRDVALKMLAPNIVNSLEHVQRFQREVKAIARLVHPNIVTAHDAREENGIHFLVMEFTEGVDLQNHVQVDGQLSVKKAVEVISQAATGLHYAHQQGIIHRDIKPSNLMITTGNVVKILDLGLARFENDVLSEAHSQDLTGKNMAMGTAAYMSPEQSFDASRVNSRTDIYSLGCTFYFLLTGRPPYQGANPVDIILAHRKQPIPSLRDSRPDATEQVDTIYRRMVAKQPEERFESMQEVLTAIDELHNLENPPVISPKQIKEEKKSEHEITETLIIEPKRNRKSVIGVIGVLTALLLFATVFVVTTSKGEVRIEVADDVGEDVEIEFRQGDKLRLVNKSKNWKLALADGIWQVSVKGDNHTIELSKDEVTIRRFGKQVVVRVSKSTTKLPRDTEVSDATRSPHDVAARRVARWIIERGGNLKLYRNRKSREAKPIKSVKDIPSDQFYILEMTVNANINGPVIRGVDENLGRLISQLKSLEGSAQKIIVRANNTDADDAFLKAISVNQNIGSLHLADTNVTDDELAYLGNMTSLHSLSLGNPVLTCESLGQIPHLSTLDITKGHGIGDAGFERIAQHEKLKKLTILDSQITDEGVTKLRNLDNWYLLSLVSAKGVTDQSCIHIAQMPKLEELYIGGTSVTDQGIAELKGLSLKKLSLRHLHKVTDNSFEYLLKMPLSHVELDDTGMTLNGKAKFNIERENCLIYREEDKVREEVERLNSQ